jgi:hypothetical protein
VCTMVKRTAEDLSFRECSPASRKPPGWRWHAAVPNTSVIGGSMERFLDGRVTCLFLSLTSR